MSEDATATDIMLGTLARNAFIAGVEAGRATADLDDENLWCRWEPSEADKAEVAHLDLRLERAAMYPDTMEVFTAMGDRSTRDTAHLMDLCIAGTIDATIGYGEITIKPNRVEELVPYIAKRRQDPDGNWIVKLDMPDFREAKVNPADVLAYLQENSMSCMDEKEDNEFVANFVKDAGKPGVTLHDLGMQGYTMFTEWVGERHNDV
jgi:hypothetical protein